MGGRFVVWSMAVWLGAAVPALAQDDLFEEAKEAESAEDSEAEGSGEQAGDEERPPGEEETTTEGDAAPAAEPVEEASGPSAPLSVGLLVGYGISLEDVNPWGFGFGLRGGYNAGDFYIGIRFAYHLGETAEIASADVFGVGSTTEVTVNEWDLGAEAGYDIHVSSVIIRPELGLGFASTAFGSSSELNPYIAPGAALLYDVGGFFVGVDGRFQAVMSSPGVNAIGLFATLGMRF